MSLLAEKYDLNSRVQLEQVSEDHVAIVKRIKSRIIKKDAIKIIEQADKIREKNKEMKVSLVCNDNICSKSVALLQENHIDVVH